jgi:hypothetical protein
LAEDPQRGMTLRDYFAAQALAGIAADGILSAKSAAEWAYTYADEMLKARVHDLDSD